MRFSWIALPLLVSTLAGAEGAPVASPGTGGGPGGEAGTHYAGSAMALPIVAMPSTVGDMELARLGVQRQVRPDHPVETEDVVNAGERRTRDARVRIRSIDRTGFDFLPGLTRALTGFLSSCTTACPPPSSR
jgi:hypothetical protein